MTEHTAVCAFLLSPASAGGRRAAILCNREADFPLARRFHSQGARLGEVFAFISGLYFRGKLAYAERFSPDPDATRVITPCDGLLPASTVVGPDCLDRYRLASVDEREDEFTGPLVRDAHRLAAERSGRIVLLGSLATAKYLAPLTMALAPGRLWVPREFTGMGDMRRGALLLRAARAGLELDYGLASDLVVRPRRRRVT